MKSYGLRLWVLYLVLAVLACGNGDAASFSRCAEDSTMSLAESRDSGEPIVSTNCHAAFEESGWVVDPTPELELGNEAEPGSSFERIQAVRSLPNRGVAVLDQGSRDLRFFDENGELVRRIGGQGAGPGEFELPFLLPTPGNHSLVVFDRTLQRLTTYSVTGELESIASTADEPWLSRVSAPSGLVGARWLIESMPIDRDVVQEAGANDLELTVLWVDVESGNEYVMMQRMVAQTYTVWDGGLPRGLTIPFAALPTVVPTEAGVLVTGGDRFEIQELDTSGRLVRVIRIDARRRPVGSGDLERYREWRVARGLSPDGLWQDFSELQVPDSMPAFSSLHVDEVGWTWAEVSGWASGQPADWMVFGPDGRARGLVRVPAGLFPHEIGEDYILGVWEDELGVPHVRRHALQR